MNCSCDDETTITITYDGGRVRHHCDRCYRTKVQPVLSLLHPDTYRVRFLAASGMYGEKLNA